MLLGSPSSPVPPPPSDPHGHVQILLGPLDPLPRRRKLAPPRLHAARELGGSPLPTRRRPVSLLSFLLLPRVPFPSPQLAIGTPPQPRLPASRSIEVPRIPPPGLLLWEQEASSWGSAASPVKLRVRGPGVGLSPRKCPRRRRF